MIYKGNSVASFSSKGVIEKTLIKNLQGQTVGETYITDEPDILPQERVVITEWTRPVAWPNLDLLSMPVDFEGVYLTYDNTLAQQESWAGFHCALTSSGTYTVAVGHIEDDEWVQDTTYSGSNGSYLYFNYKDLNINSNYLVFKIYPASGKHFTRFGFGQIPVATTGNTLYSKCWYQHCLERRGRLPYITSTSWSSENYGMMTEWMECDNTVIGESNTGNMDLSGAFRYGARIRKTGIENWPVNQWNVTSLSATFYNCRLLEDLSVLSSWNTTNWHVTSIENIFCNCLMLKKCGAFNWNVVNWGNTSTRKISFASAFNWCCRLEEIDLNGWDTSSLVVTSLSSTFNGCYNTKKIKIDKWITTNWQVNSLYATFCNCAQLTDLNLSGWNTTNWVVTRMDSCFSGCFKLRDLSSIEGWNTSNWPMNNSSNNFNSVFSNCYKIPSLNLNHWDVSGWGVTNIGSLFNNCYNLRTLEVGQWDTSNWAVTNIGSLLASCRSLKKFTGFNWDTSNWPVTAAISYMFYYCQDLEEIDFTKWDTTKFNLGNVSMTYFCNYCYAAKKIDLSNLDCAGITTLSNTGNGSSTSLFYQCYNLEQVKIPKNYKGYVRLADCFKLSKDQIVGIFNDLKTTSSAIALQIGEIRYKLKAADIKIVTDKGYTVS